MRGLLIALCQQLGVILPSGAIDLSLSDGEHDGSFTFYDGPSFTWTDEGIEGPCWASLWEHAPTPESDRPDEPEDETKNP